MFTAIPHKNKDQTGFFTTFGIETEETVIYPAQVMIKTTSGHKVLDLYVRNSNGHVYAKNGQYLICLMNSNLTSNSKITWVELDGIDEVYDKCHLTYSYPMKAVKEKD